MASTQTLEIDVSGLTKKLDKILSFVSGEESRQKKTSNIIVSKGNPLDTASCLGDFMSLTDDITLTIGEKRDGNAEIKHYCTICRDYLNSKQYLGKEAAAARRPTGNSLLNGLGINEATYTKLEEGQNQIWYRFKKILLDRAAGFESQTHQDAVKYKHDIGPVNRRGYEVVKKQIRAAIGVVKSKGAAIHYENHIAELHDAGADVGYFGHCRKMFFLMMQATSAYIDDEISKYLKHPLPSTGLCPHFYVTCDKSTNHRTTNQVSMICLIVDGKREAIALNAHSVYNNSLGDGGSSTNLAKKVLADLKNHAGISGEGLYYLSGKVIGGQYLHDVFNKEMNDAIWSEIPEQLHDELWWPLQW